MDQIKFVNEYGTVGYQGIHPMCKVQSKFGPKLTQNDIRRNRKVARRWKMVSARYWSGWNTSDCTGPYYEGGEFEFSNRNGHVKFVTVSSVTNKSKTISRKW